MSFCNLTSRVIRPYSRSCDEMGRVGVKTVANLAIEEKSTCDTGHLPSSRCVYNTRCCVLTAIL